MNKMELSEKSVLISFYAEEICKRDKYILQIRKENTQLKKELNELKKDINSSIDSKNHKLEEFL